MTPDELDRILATRRTCHTSTGQKFRVNSRRRYVSIYERGDGGPPSIEYRSDSISRAIAHATNRRGHFVVDTATDKIVYPMARPGLT